MDALPPNTYTCVDAFCIVTLLGALLGWMPSVAAVFAICWYSILMWESSTGKWWRSRWRRLFVRVRIIGGSRDDTG